MRGGPSQVDLFDYKPALEIVDGQPVPKRGNARYWKSAWEFKKRGESGLPISELYPQLADRHADELCLVNSMQTDVGNHVQAVTQMLTGSFQFIRPSVGAWALYGLGTENDSLPGFISICPSFIAGGAKNFGSAFLPAACQGTPIGEEFKPLTDEVTLPNVIPMDKRNSQRRKLDLLQAIQHDRLQKDGRNDRLEAVIASYELALRMQTAIPEVMNLQRETKSTLAAYGIGEKATDSFGRQCLMARRFVESGVRFVQLNMERWDNHVNLVAEHGARGRSTDQPIAALLSDLKQRDLLKDTLIIWGGEFGRPPYLNTSRGRDHDNVGFTVWLAGGGVKGGLCYGATDNSATRPSKTK